MDDLISRQALLKTLNENKIEFNSDVNYFIMHAPSVNQWIPCSERLPEPYHRVILTIRGTDMIKVEEGETLEQALKRNNETYWVTTGYLADDGWNGVDGFPLIVKPIAWMEFPEPWREDERAD